MDAELDDQFFNRADAHIHLSYDQIVDINPGKISSSMMYATAIHSKSALRIPRSALSKLFDNLDDYASKFDTYMKSP